MKQLNLIYPILIFALISSCKNDNSTKPDDKPTTPVIAVVHDSISYTVDGKIYTYTPKSGSFNDLSTGGQEVDRKVVYADSNNKSNYGLVGTNPDSVLYYQKNSLFSDNAGIAIYFIKKYAKKHKDDGVLYTPELNDLLKLFAVGKRSYAEDFGWQNSQNGIAMNILVNGKAYASYNAFDPNKPSTLKPGFQKESTFEIINFTKATSGGYNLEARFTAIITNANETKKLENGYLSLNFVPFVAAN